MVWRDVQNGAAIKHRQASLAPGWVTARVLSGKKLATHPRVDNQVYQQYPNPTVTPTIANGHSCRAQAQ